MRGLVLMAVVLAGAGGAAGAAVARPSHGAGVADAGLPGADGTVRPDGAAQPHGMVGGAGGPGGATCAGGRGNGSRPHHHSHHSGNRHRVDPLAGSTAGKHGGGRCVD